MLKRNTKSPVARQSQSDFTQEILNGTIVAFQNSVCMMQKAADRFYFKAYRFPYAHLSRRLCET